MTKTAAEIQAELNAYVDSLTEKKLNVSDKRLIAANSRSQDWYKKTVKRNKENANNLEIRKKISKKTKGKKINPESSKKAIETRKKNGNNHAWNKGISPSEQTKEKLSKLNKGKKLSEDTKQKIKNNAAKNKAIHTPEGIFPSRTQAAEHYFNQGIKNSSSISSISVWIFSQLKKDPNNFYYI